MAWKTISDISSYQSDSLAFMNQLKSAGINGLMVKLTDGTTYLNPKSGNQVSNGLKVFKTVGLYHYYQGSPAAEANYFIKWVKAFGMDTSTPLAIDVEDPSLYGDITSQINTFLSIVKANGYKCRLVYGSASWFNSKKINYARLTDKNIWVASYGSSQPGVNRTNAWQFTDNYKGLHVDASYDFDGTLTGERFESIVKPATPAVQNSNFVQDGRFFYSEPGLNAYHDQELTSQRKVRWGKGSYFYGTIVKVGNRYRIKTAVGYVSAYKDWVKKVE